MSSQLQVTLQQVVQAFQGGNFDGAKSILYAVLQNDINSTDAIFELGATYTEENRLSESRIIFNCLESLNIDNPDISYGLGFVCAMQEDFECALKCFDKVIKLRPNDLDALVNYASTLHELKRFDEALIAYEKVLALKGDDGMVFYNIGNTLHELKHYEKAIAYYGRALSLKPDYAEAWSNKGITLNELKRFDEAIAHYDQALILKPDHAKDWSNKGATLHEFKRFDEALLHHEKALSLKPDYAEAWFNKGNVLNELKQYNEAIAHYDKALGLKPDYAEAWLNKGNILNELKQYNEAIAHYDKALILKPDYAEAWSNKGVILSELKQYNEAIAHYDKALSLKPDIDWLSGGLLHLKMRVCSWNDLDNSVDVISKKVMLNQKVSNPFPLLALNDDAFLHKKCSEIYSQGRYLVSSILGPIPKATKKEKIRVGYFSADFRNHAVSFLTAELFEIHDRAKFEIIAFSLQRASVDDEMNLRLRKRFDRFIDAENMSDQKIAQLARDLEIDIAVDLGGHTAGGRVGIFSYRTAPIQVNWLGYPGTMGINFIDYIVADKTIIPDHYRKFYSEKVVTLPDIYLVDDSKRIASSRVFTRKECGLPEHGFIFCCFNNDFKFNPKVLDGWSRILLATKNSTLWISENNEYFRANLIVEFQKRGIDSNRIIFAIREDLMADHLARYGLADLFLDTFPYNAHTTTVDSLKAGVPVLTRMGQSFASRVAASLLNAVGLPELVTNTTEEYEALAIELALNPQKLADIKLKLANNRLTTSLFDTPRFTKNLEAAYLQMYERYQADLPPDHISIV